MKTNKFAKGFIFALIMVVTIIFICVSGISDNKKTAFSDTLNADKATFADGSYTVKISNDMPMGKNSISSEAVLEKNGRLYYLTVEFKRTSIDNPELKIDGKNPGQTVVKDTDEILSVTYTLSEEYVFLPLEFTVYIVKMKTSKNVKITVDKTSAVKTGEFDASIKRAPEFVTDGDTIDKRDHSSDMPVWGYFVIGTAVIIVVAVIIVIVVKAHKKKRSV